MATKATDAISDKAVAAAYAFDDLISWKMGEYVKTTEIRDAARAALAAALPHLSVPDEPVKPSESDEETARRALIECGLCLWCINDGVPIIAHALAQARKEGAKAEREACAKELEMVAGKYGQSAVGQAFAVGIAAIRSRA